jgi:hypothetical protein
MSKFPRTTIAGRHAADVARIRERRTQVAEEAARERLARSFRRHGLTAHPHFEPELGNERTLWVDCRLETGRTDHAHIYAILDTLGWKPDRARLSRYGERYDIVRLRHTETNAALVLIIKVPFGEVTPLEAA